MFDAANLFILQQRQKRVLKLLKGHGCHPISERNVLEIGCGSGKVLLEYLTYGAAWNRLHGMDLLHDRVLEAHNRAGHQLVSCADGQDLPYRDGSFDIVLQYTVFSSILHEEIKSNIAREMLRVLRKPDGLIVWYDFWLNPLNKQTKGVFPSEIRRLFKGCTFEFHRITVAPPLARVLVPRSWILAALLEKVRIVNTHYLAAIRPDSW